MAESAERSVIFRLKVEPGKGALDNATKFGKSLETIQTKVFDSIERRMAAAMDNLSRLSKAAEGGATGGRRASPQASDPRKDTAREAARAASDRAKAEERASREFLSNLRNEQKERDRISKENARKFEKSINDAIRLREKEAKEAARLLKSQEKEQERIHTRHRQRQRAIASQNRQNREREAREATKILEREANEAARIQREQDKEAERIHKRHRERQRSIAAQNRKDRLQEAKEIQAGLRATEQQMAAATGRLSAANGLLTEGLVSSGDALIKMGTGLATIGLLSEQNSEKMLRGLVLIRGVNDAVAGGIELWVRTSRVVEGYKATLDAVKATQTAIAAQQAIGAVAAARGAAAGASGAAASAAGGAAGSAVAGGAAGGVAVTAIQKATLFVGGALTKLGTVAAAAAAPLAKFGVILAGIPSLLDVIASGSITPREGSVREGVVNAGGGMIAGVTAFANRMAPDAILPYAAMIPGGEASSAEISNRQTAKMEDEQAKRRERIENQRFLDSQAFARTEAQSAVDLQPHLSAVGTATKPEDKISAIDSAQEAITRQQATLQATDTSGNTELRVKQMQAIIDLDNQAVSLAEQRKQEETKILQAKREQATVAIDASRKELDNAKQTLATAKDRIAATREAMQSAAVRLAQASPEEQQKFLEISQKASRNEVLTRDEREIAFRYSVGNASQVANQQAIDEVRRRGLMDVDNAKLQQQLATDEEIVKRNRKIVQEIQTEIELKESFVIKSELDERAITNAFNEAVAKRFAHIEELLKAQAANLKEMQVQQMNAKSRELGARRTMAGG